MTRILGEHFTTAGKPKRKFTTKKAAQQFAAERNLNVDAYLCTFCQKWHLATLR